MDKGIGQVLSPKRSHFKDALSREKHSNFQNTITNWNAFRWNRAGTKFLFFNYYYYCCMCMRSRQDRKNGFTQVTMLNENKGDDRGQLL